MKTNRQDEKYTEIFQELKEDKMNWDFDDFLAQAKEEEKIIPLAKPAKTYALPKIFWIAASVTLLAALGIFFNTEKKKTISEQDEMAKNEILKQKEDFIKASEVIAFQQNDSVNIVRDSLITDSASTQIDADIVEKIMPKRGRIRRESRPQYVQNMPEKSAKKDQNSNYNSNYVIINGQKIEDEQEAIDLTKYSFRILSENVSKTVASTEAMNLNNDY